MCQDTAGAGLRMFCHNSYIVSLNFVLDKCLLREDFCMQKFEFKTVCTVGWLQKTTGYLFAFRMNLLYYVMFEKFGTWQRFCCHFYFQMYFTSRFTLTRIVS